MDRQEFIDRLRRILGPMDVLSSRADCATYGYDASVFQGEEIIAVAFPESAAEVVRSSVSPVRRKIPYVARGSGTGISGGAIPTQGGLVIELANMNRVLEIDLANQRVWWNLV